jgi:MFS family permease
VDYDFKSVKQNEKFSILNGVSSTIVASTSNNYFSLFAISVLGATNYQVGLISSLPQFIGMFAMIIGSFILGRLEEKKKFTALSILFTRLFVLSMVFIMFVPTEYRSWVFVFLIGFMNFPGSFMLLSWQSLIGDLIPDKRRNSFFSERNRILTIVGMFTTFLMGVILQQFDKANPLPYQILFFIAFIFGVVEVYYLFKHVEHKKEISIKPIKEKKLQLNWDVFKDKRFVIFLICSLYFNFTWQMAWSLFNIYQIKYAYANGLWISLFTVANQISQVISYKWWGKMADKHSNAKMLIFVSLGMASAPLLTVLSTNLYYLIVVNVFTGLFVSGTVLILFNQLLEVTKEENRSSYIANYNILLAIIGFVAPQFGVFLLEISNINIAMTTSTIFRASSSLVFIWLYIALKKSYPASQLGLNHRETHK